MKNVKRLDIYQDVTDKKISTRHKAPYLLIADTRRIDSEGKTLSKHSFIVARVFTRNEGLKFQNDISSTLVSKQVGFAQDGQPKYAEVPGKAYRISSWNDKREVSYEVIDKYRIVEKSEYFKLN